MELKPIEDKTSAKRDCRLSRARSQKTTKCNLLEAIAQVHGGGVISRRDEDGVVRMKIVVRKQELKHMLAMMGGGKSNPSPPSISSSSSSLLSSVLSTTSLEHRLSVMRRRHLRRPDHVKGSHFTWRPALQSIPEEL